MKQKIKVIKATYDFMFKAVILDKENRDFLKKLIHEASHVPMNNLKSLSVENNEYLVNNKKDKRMRSDVIISVNKLCINIEMNQNYYVGLFMRNNRYLTKLSADLVDDDYINLKGSIQINFDDFSIFKTKQEVHEFTMKEVKSNEVLEESDKIIHIDMEYIYNKCYNKPVDNLSFLERTCLILKSSTVEELDKYAGDDEMFKKIANKIKKLSSDKKMIGLYDAKEEDERIKRTIRIGAQREGLSEGLAQGLS